MLEFPMGAFSAGNLHEASLAQVGDKLADFARHVFRFSYSKLPANAGFAVFSGGRGCGVKKFQKLVAREVFSGMIRAPFPQRWRTRVIETFLESRNADY